MKLKTNNWLLIHEYIWCELWIKEKKEEGKKEEEEKKKEEEEEKEKEKAKEEEPIVLKVDMHCEACARKVARSLKGFEGHYH